MTERIVVLDAATLGPATLRRPAFAHDWVEYRHSEPADMVERLRGASIAITNKAAFDAPLLSELDSLKLIAIAATGHDIVDLNAAREAGIAVVNVRGYARTTVPEHTFALILALRRRLVEFRRAVAAGEWQQFGEFTLFTEPVHDLAGSVLGIVGFGATGRKVATIGNAFGMRVAVLDSHVREAPGHIELKDWPALLDCADVLTLHCPLTDETRHLVDADALGRMKPTSILVNTARGGLVDAEALAIAIRDGRIGGAGIDVLEREPPEADDALYRLRDHPRLWLTPHCAWSSLGALETLSETLIDQIEAFVAGRPLERLV